MIISDYITTIIITSYTKDWGLVEIKGSKSKIMTLRLHRLSPLRIKSPKQNQINDITNFYSLNDNSILFRTWL